MSVSVLILTLNEERNLPGCLESVAGFDDVVIFDSFSTDRTVEIARNAGARIFQRQFDNYGNQREAARTQVTYKYPWVLALDADERVDEELKAELKTITALPETSHRAYRVRRKDFFMGKWIKRSTLYPSWFVRFYQPSWIRYEPRAVHEYPRVEGSIGELQGHLHHYSFNNGLSAWLSKHVRYADLEAHEGLQTLRAGHIDWKGLFSQSDPVRRRRAIKGLSCYMPFRPTLRFLYMYVLRLGVLDGLAGLTYCRMLAMYEYMIVIKMREIQRREKGLTV